MSIVTFYLKLRCFFIWIFLVSVLYLIVAIFTKQRSTIFAKTVNCLGKGILPIAGIKLNIEGTQYLTAEHPCVVLGNHQSALDVAIFGAMCPPNTVGIGKKEIAMIPLFGWLFKYSGGILIDRKNKRKAISQIDEAVQAVIKQRVSIGILPEGTRNRLGKGLLPFKKGAFHLAIAAQVPLVPIVVAEFGVLVNFEKKILKRGTINVRVLPPISTKGMTESQTGELTEKTYQLMLSALNEIKSVVH